MRATRRRLTDEQRELAAQNMPLAENIARKYARRFGGPEAAELREEIYSAALVALCKAAAKFDPSRPVRFSSYAYPTINRDIWRAILLFRARGVGGDRQRHAITPTVVSLNARVTPHSTVGDLLGDHCGPVGWEMESEEAVRRAAARVPGPARNVLLAYLLDASCHGRQAEAGRRYGYSPRRTAQILDDALAGLWRIER